MDKVLFMCMDKVNINLPLYLTKYYAMKVYPVLN